jgi:hypothetical protein
MPLQESCPERAAIVSECRLGGNNAARCEPRALR